MNTHRVYNLMPEGRSRSERLSQQDSHECFLSMDIFRDLKQEDVVEIDQLTQPRTCRKGQIIYAQDERAERLFLLKQGRVHIYRLTVSGKRLALETIEAGTFFGEMPIIGETLRNSYAEAAADSDLSILSRQDIERVLHEWPAVAFRIIQIQSQRLMMYQNRLEEFAYRSVSARIAAVLLRTHQEQQGQVVTLTHQELGDMVGAMRETVTKTLDELQRAGMVELSRGRLILRDVDGLRAWIKE